MSRSVGDFCLKDYGLISTPQVSYRKLTRKDEFIVLATDGVSFFKKYLMPNLQNRQKKKNYTLILVSYHEIADMGCVDKQSSDQHSCFSKEQIHGS